MSDPRQSFCKSLFFGDLPEDLVFPYPRVDRAERLRLRELLAELNRVGRAVIDPQKLDSEDGPARAAEARAALARLGLFGLNVPGEYGGLGLSLSATCRVLQELAALDQGLALTITAHLFLGVGTIAAFAQPALRQRLLPALCRGERIAAFCLTEPLAGSDAAAVRARARIASHPGQPVGYQLTGTKVWVSNGGIADVFVVFAQTQVEREGAPVDRITAFLVERGPGLRTGAEEPKVGVRASSMAAVYLDDVSVGPEAILGTVGGGFKVAMEALSLGRPALAASCVGAARELFRLTLQHATSRRQFGRLVSSFGMIKDKVAQMQTELYAAESLVYLTTGLRDRAPRGDHALEAACVKVFASEMLQRTVHESLALVAGAGFSRAFPHERYLRDARAPLLFLGTNEILRAYIALTGLAGPGEQLAKLADAIKYPLRGYGVVVDSLLDKVKFAATGGAALTRHHPRLKKEAVLIEDDVDGLAQAVERSLRKHGRQISEMQYVQRRLAETAVLIYAMVAVVSRASEALQRATRHAGVTISAILHSDEVDREVRLARAFCLRAHSQVRARLAQMVDNDDELRKGLADSAYHGRFYPFDAVLGDRDD